MNRRVRALPLIALAVMATAPARGAPPPTPTPVPTVQAAPIGPGPWILLDARYAVLADGLADTWFDKADFGNARMSASGPGIWLPAALKALPEAAREMLGRPLVLLTPDASVRCPVRVKALWAASVAVFNEHEGSPFYLAMGAVGDDGTDPTLAERAANAWKTGRRVLLAELAPESDQACDGPLIAARPEAVPAQLRSARAAPAAAAKALRALRASAFWEVQQEAYQKSLVVARVRYRQEREEERKRQIADGIRPGAVDLRWITDPTRGAPKTWDTPLRNGARPEILALSDPGGALQYILVHAGNDLSCAAPAAWALFDATYALVDFGLAPRSQLVLDWDGDGQPDLYEGGWHWGRATPLGQPGRPPLAALEVQPSGLSCSWEQIAPLSVEAPEENPKPP